jgi:hypothetical protein
MKEVFKHHPFMVAMRKADIFCDSDMEDFQVKACGIDFAGVIALGLIDPDLSPTDSELQSSTWWETMLVGSPQMVYLIRNTRGEIPAGSVTTGEGFGKEDLQVTGAARTATIEYEGMKENWDATEGANRRDWKMVFFTMANLMYYVNFSASFFATPVVGRDKKVGQFYQAQITWQDFSNPKVLDSPDIL